MPLPLRLKYVLRATRINLVDFAARIGRTRQSVERWINGKQPATEKHKAAVYQMLAAQTPEADRLRAWLNERGMAPACLFDRATTASLGATAKPVWLKRALKECRIRMADFAARIDRTRQSVELWLNGRRPVTASHKQAVYKMLAGGSEEAERIRQWLQGYQFEPEILFLPLKRGETKTQKQTARKRLRHQQNVDDIKTEAVMISLKTMRHFKLQRSPFANEINDARDIFMSSDHIFIKEMMLESARHSGFTAIYGEVGCGKSTMRKAIVKELRDDGIQIIFPQILDKRRITATSLLDAVIMDITEERPKRSMEAKTRQALSLLKARRQNGLNQVLVIEEAHLMNVWALKHLKTLWEFEDGYRKLLGIVLLGQPELASKLDETQYPQLREVIRRITMAQIDGLNESDLMRYLVHKIERCNGTPEAVFSDDAYPAINRRLKTDDGSGRIRNLAFPLSINNVAAQAMNAACDLGESRVTAELVYSL